ncbi:MAG: SpoIIE family protein phosphatase [Planctomycetes bacterium]|nr:SpoIIE family protein phosphatase [Planctomycetota bacterium]
MANPPNRPINTPPPPTVSAPPPAAPATAATPPPARASSGMVPAVKGQTKMMGRPGAGAPPAGGKPPAGGGGAASKPPAAGGGGAQPPRTVGVAKPSGMPIKTKIVVAMSMLAGGTALLMFAVVNMITASSLQSTIEESGVGMLQEAEALQRNYRAGLSEKSLIAYFSQEANASKFDEYWNGGETSVNKSWADPNIPLCRNFGDFEQLGEDHIWVLVAQEFKNKPERAFGPNATADDIIAIGTEVLGEQWKQVREAKGPVSADVPRRVNKAALEGKYRTNIGPLMSYWKMGDKKYRDWHLAMLERIQTGLVDPPGGLRRFIQSKYREDFVRDLDRLTTAEGTQVKHIVFETAPGNKFSKEEVTIISPQPESGKEGVKLAPSNQTKRIGDVEVDAGVTINGKAGFGFSKVTDTQDKVRIYLDGEKVKGRVSSLITYLLLVALVAVALAVGTAFVIGQGITKPLQTLMHDIQVISSGNFDHRPQARSTDEIGIVSRLLGDMAAGLKSAQQLWAENQSRKHDLDIAKEIQENLLPKHVPRIAGYDVSAYYSSAKEVGGDYYDFFLVDKTHLGMICADVSGKGIPGSMVMMMAKALITYEAENNLSPRDIFVKVNRTLAKDIKRGMFVTAFYMLLDIPTARLTLASAGHNPLLHYRAATKQCVQVNPGGIALGFDKDGRLFERNMKEETIQLQRGDRVVIYTDGVTEAMSPDNQEFGEERLLAITTQNANAASTPYLTALVNALQAHAQSDEQHDDITIVTLKVG